MEVIFVIVHQSVSRSSGRLLKPQMINACVYELWWYDDV